MQPRAAIDATAGSRPVHRRIAHNAEAGCGWMRMSDASHVVTFAAAIAASASGLLVVVDETV